MNDCRADEIEKRYDEFPSVMIGIIPFMYDNMGWYKCFACCLFINHVVPENDLVCCFYCELLWREAVIADSNPHYCVTEGVMIRLIGIVSTTVNVA